MSHDPHADPGPAQAGPVVSAVIDYGDGIAAIDTGYVRPYLAASHLIVQSGRAAFVDTGSTHSVPRLLAALAARGLDPQAVDWIFLTHIHLDHAGGAGALARALPNARVVVHPRGLAHLADPARLVAATKAVYGEALYASLYGEIVPIPADRLVASSDGGRLELAGRPFDFLHTPGHALHHHVIIDRHTQSVFTGDTFGLSYRELDVDGRAFVLPTTTPTQFDPAQLGASIDRILAERPRAVFMTHYGRVTEVERLGAELHEGIAAFVAMARRLATARARAALMTAEMFEWLSARLDAHGYRGDAAARHAVLDADIELNVQGLEAWLGRAG